MSGAESASRPRARTPLVAFLLLLVIGALGGSWAWLSRRRVSATPLSEPGAWLESALANQAAGPYSELWGQLVVERAAPSLPLTHVAAEGKLEGTPPLHEPFQRTYFNLEPSLAPPVGLGGLFRGSMYPGQLPETRPVLTLVGVWTRGLGPEPSAVFEVVAYSESLQPEGARWIFGPPRARSLHAGSLRARRAAGQVFLPPR